MGDNGEDINSDTVHELRQKLHSGEDTDVGKWLTFVSDGVQLGWSFRKMISDLNKLEGVHQHILKIEEIAEKATEDGSELIKYAQRNLPEDLKDNCSGHYTGTILEDVWNKSLKKCPIGHFDKGEVKDLMLESLTKYKKEQSNKMVNSMLLGNLNLAIIQVVKLRLAFKTINEASNIVRNEEKFNQINKNIKEMENMVTEVLDLYLKDPSNHIIDRKLTKIAFRYTKTHGHIIEIKVNINGTIERIGITRGNALLDGVSNLTTATIQGFQLWHTWSDLMTATKAAGIAVTSMLAGLGLANYKVYTMSSEELLHLRNDLQNTIRLQERLEELYDKANELLETKND